MAGDIQQKNTHQKYTQTDSDTRKNILTKTIAGASIVRFLDISVLFPCRHLKVHWLKYWLRFIPPGCQFHVRRPKKNTDQKYNKNKILIPGKISLQNPSPELQMLSFWASASFSNSTKQRALVKVLVKIYPSWLLASCQEAQKNTAQKYIKHMSLMPGKISL